jgi:type II secretory pathway pseudopilin PulG
MKTGSIVNNIRSNRGFTILEITVVIFIITLALIGILSLSNQNVQVQYINKNTVIASQLAQEGLELVRNKRDTNWFRGENWEHSSSTGSRLDILPGGTSGSGVAAYYTIDAATGAIYTSAGITTNGINDSATNLYINSAGLYTHAVTATSTGFSRLITVGNESTASTSVTCLVRWKRGVNTYNFTAQTVLYNWK